MEQHLKTDKVNGGRMKMVCVGGMVDGKTEEVLDGIKMHRVCVYPELMSFSKFDSVAADISQDVRFDHYVVESLHCGDKLVVKLLRHQHLTMEQVLHRLIHHYQPPGSANERTP